MTDIPAPIPEQRELSGEERKLAQWMLEHGESGALSFRSQLDRARVVSRCPCGCASIDLEVSGAPTPSGEMRILGDFLYGDESNLAGVFIFERGGTLAGIEVYGLAVDAPRTLPNPSGLRPFDAPAP